MALTLALIDQPDAILRSVIAGGIVAFNESRAGPNNAKPLAVALVGDDDRAIGGLWGKTSYSWLFVELLFVPEPLRGQNWGSRLMEAAEAEAIARGCVGAWLDTYDFQAKTFYEGLGYAVFGELNDHPPGASRFFMRKHFARAP